MEESMPTPYSTLAFPLFHHGLISSRRVLCGPHLPVLPAPQRLVTPTVKSRDYSAPVSHSQLCGETQRYLPLLLCNQLLLQLICRLVYTSVVFTWDVQEAG